MRHLVIGMGEVGTALYQVLLSKHDVIGIDKEEEPVLEFDFVHICFPHFKGFIREVKRYKKQYLKKGGVCVIHSTVPVGTSRRCEAVHSPIRGIHPNLKESILTFTKYFGGEGAQEVAWEFGNAGVNCKTFNSPEETEAMKLWDLAGYWMNILFQKDVKRYCDKHGLDFHNCYTEPNLSYNAGYEKLGFPQFKKYVLKDMPGPTGGHCIRQNVPHLKSKLAKFLIKREKELGTNT